MKRIAGLKKYGLLVGLLLAASLCRADYPPFALSPASLNFGKQVLDTTSGAGAVTLTNHLATTLTILGVNILGDFSQTNDCGGSVKAGGSCTIKVYFTPTLIGNETGVLMVSSDASNSPQSVVLSGTGVIKSLVSIAVSPSNASIPAGIKQQFSALGFFKDGSTQDLTSAVTWSSSNASVASVSNAAGSQGLATSLSQGAASIVATASSVTGASVLTVTAPALASIAVIPANPSIPLGLTQQFTATGTYTDGSTKDVSGLVTWVSNSPSVASITSQGLASSLAHGSTVIYALDGSVRGSAVLSVTAPVLASIAVSPANPSISLGLSQQFAATGTYTDGSTQDVSGLVAWVSSNPSVAPISSQGLAGSLAPGSTVIYALTNSFHASTVLTVIGRVLVSIAISPAIPTVALGDTLQLSATGTYSDGSTTNFSTGQHLFWYSSNPAVAAISSTGLPSGGLVKSFSEGTTTITAVGLSYPPNSSSSTSTTLTVTAPSTAMVVVKPASPALPQGTTLQLTATELFPDGTSQDVTAAATWTSANSAAATISNDAGSQGLATGLASGTTAITATVGGVSGSNTLTVVPPGGARFAFVNNLSDLTVSTYVVDSSTGQLTPGPTTLMGLTTAPLAVTADPSGKFLYVTCNPGSGPCPGIAAYSIEPVTGSLTPIALSIRPTSSVGTLVMHPSGRFLLDFEDPLSVYSIDSITGALTLLNQQNLVGAGAFDPTGKFLYAVDPNANNLSAFTFDSTTGGFTPVPGSPFSIPGNPGYLAVHPSGNFVYVGNANGQSVSGYALDTVTGALSPLPGSPFTVGFVPGWIIFDPAGKFAFIANSSSSSISAFTVDATKGALYPVAESPFPTGNGPRGTSVDPLGNFLFVVNEEGENLSTFAIDPVTGALTSVGTVATGLAPLSIAIVK